MIYNREIAEQEIFINANRPLVKQISRSGVHYNLLSGLNIKKYLRKFKILIRLLNGERFEDEEHNKVVREIYYKLKEQAK